MDYKFKTKAGINREIIIQISKSKNEPQWMLKKRLDAFEIFKKKPLPNWGPSLKKLDLNKITYYLLPNAKPDATSWKDVPKKIKNTFEKLGIPEAEQKFLSGTGAQYESLVVYHNLKKEWEKQGVIFEDCDVALQKYPETMKQYFMKCVSPSLHKFAALHGAVWSGGTFLYVPKGIKITMPLQAYFRMNARRMGQFEHTLIIVDEGAQAHYIEGCSAPLYTESSLHAGCVEIFVKKGARVRYSSVENWSKNTFNLNTKRAIIEEEGTMEWVGANMGSGCTMLYPCSILKGENSRADHIAIAYAGKGQNQDTGAKVYHLAPNTSSLITSKSISKNGGITTYRGLINIVPGAENCKARMTCDALLIGKSSKTYTVPRLDIQQHNVEVAHEATVGRISQEHIFYLMSRGLSEQQAVQLIVSGFIEPIVKQLPLEYAVEMNRLIELEIENAIG